MITILNQKFKGKKTYAAAIAAVLSAAITFFMGESTIMEALQLGVTGIIGATLRSGIDS